MPIEAACHLPTFAFVNAAGLVISTFNEYDERCSCHKEKMNLTPSSFCLKFDDQRKVYVSLSLKLRGKLY
jgi:hypothetical protein